MSRTFRRNKRHLIQLHCGHREDALKDGWWMPRRYRGLPMDDAYQRFVRRYTSDSFGRGGIPRTYVRSKFTRPQRLETRNEILRCVRRDCWDDHQSPHFRHSAARYYW